MDAIRDMLVWLGVESSGISNLNLIIGLVIGFLLLVGLAYGGYLLSLLASRIAHEHRQSAQKARAASANAIIEAQKKEGEARVHRAQMDARATQEEQRLQEIKDGPQREGKRLREEIAALKKTIEDRDRTIAEKIKEVEGAQAVTADLEGKYEIQEQQIKQLMLDISGLKMEYRDIDVQRDTFKARAETAEATAAKAIAESERLGSALRDLEAIKASLQQLTTATQPQPVPSSAPAVPGDLHRGDAAPALGSTAPA